MDLRRQPLGKERDDAGQIDALQQMHVVENEKYGIRMPGQRVLQQLVQQAHGMRVSREAECLQLPGEHGPRPQRAAEAVPEILTAVGRDELAEDLCVRDPGGQLLLPPFQGGRFAVAHGGDDGRDGMAADARKRFLQALGEIQIVDRRMLIHKTSS